MPPFSTDRSDHGSHCHTCRPCRPGNIPTLPRVSTSYVAGYVACGRNDRTTCFLGNLHVRGSSELHPPRLRAHNHVHERRSQAHLHAPGDEEKVKMRKQKAESKSQEAEHSPKKPKHEESGEDGYTNGKSVADVAAEYDEFCKAIKEHLSVEQMRQVLEANGLDSSGSDLEITRRCQDVVFYGALEKCPVCNGTLEFDGRRYSCRGFYSEWSSCTFRTRDPPRKEEAIKLPDSVQNSPVSDLLKKYRDPIRRPHRDLGSAEKPFTGMMISLMGRLTRTHQYWKKTIEKHGGKVANSVIGATCLVASPAERERGGTSKLAEAMERGIRVVREDWLIDSIEKQEPQPLESYDLVSDLSVDGKGIPWDKQDPGEESIESLSAELKLYGKRGVYKDSKLQDQGGKIFEKDGILYNCAFSLCDQGRGLNDFCVMQLIMVPENRLHLYCKEGRVGDDPNAQERLEEFQNIDSAVKEFLRLFYEKTGNEFEPWEKEKKFQKKPLKFYPIDMDDGVEVRHGALALRQLGIAVTHCKLEPLVANFMKVLCSQEIYKYALMEMAYDSPDLPVGMVTNLHLKRCEEVLLEFIEKVKSMKEGGPKAEAVWSDFSQRWFTLMHSTRPFNFRDYQEIADHAASALECIRDITVASHLIRDMTGSTIDDPLSDRYEKLGCSISPLEKNSSDYDMIVKYLEKTYEPVRVGDVDYGVSVDNIFAVESKACPSYEDIVKLPNKVLLWCGSRSSNLLRHLHKGFLPAICSLPVPGYMFGGAIVCSDAAAEAARYGFTAVDRPEGFLVLAIASLGNEITELKNPPEDTKSLEEKKNGVKGLGRKKTDESEHFVWKDDIKVPSGRLVASEHKDSPLEYNEYAVYDPKQVRISYLVEVKYEEKGMVMDTAE
ncbi:protein ADP-ribosyltransferase PARP3-like [Neltuma alba]|uniref:protein ADP-ribosyltransferase PARP3-like n=1 Tax=Neltuma alba TaxID=207710 RepID=UPI0010A42AD7|nr:protein ADP-ribosyltransferase PARP3-like [Prosopis alba]